MADPLVQPTFRIYIELLLGSSKDWPYERTFRGSIWSCHARLKCEWQSWSLYEVFMESIIHKATVFMLSACWFVYLERCDVKIFPYMSQSSILSFYLAFH